MIGGKVVLTYKRKRSSSKSTLTHEDECPSSSTEHTPFNASTTPDKHEESKEHHSGISHEHDVCAVGGSLLHFGSCSCSHHEKCMPSVKRLRNSYTRQKYSSMSLQARRLCRSMEKELLDESRSKQMTLYSHSPLTGSVDECSLLDTKVGFLEDESSKEMSGQLQVNSISYVRPDFACNFGFKQNGYESVEAESGGRGNFACLKSSLEGKCNVEGRSACKQMILHSHTPLTGSVNECSLLDKKVEILEDGSSKEMSGQLQVNSISYVSSEFACNDELKQKVYDSVEAESGMKEYSACLKSSIERNCNSEAAIAFKVEKSSEGSNLPSEGNSVSFCSDSITVTKLSSPLITFCRRSKQKKGIDQVHMHSNLLADQTNSSLAEKDCPIDLTTDLKHSEKDAKTRSTFARSEEMTGNDVDSQSLCAGYIPVTVIKAQVGEQPDETNRLLKIAPSLAEHSGSDPFSLHTNVVIDIKEDAPAGSSSAGIAIDTQSVLSTYDVTVSSGEKLSHMNLSAPLPALESGSNDHSIPTATENLPDLLDSINRSHTTDLPKVFPQCRELELLDERIGGTLLADSAQIIGQSGNLVKEAGGKCIDRVDSSIMGVPWSNGIQHCAKDKTIQMFPSTNTLQKTVPCEDSEEETTVHCPCGKSQPEPKSVGSALFLGLSLPANPDIDVCDLDPLTSQRPNFDIKSREYIQDTVHQSSSSQASSFMRHKMILDNIVGRAQALKGNGISCLDNFVPRSSWSEEELDFLWIGVRRHGKGNWDTLLRDPKLLFSSWRTARDLSERWQEEQSKLLNNAPFSHLGAHDFLDHKHHRFKRARHRENLADDTQLSLGDVYAQAENYVPKRSCGLASVQSDGTKHIQTPVAARLRTFYSYSHGAKHKRPMLNQLESLPSSVVGLTSRPINSLAAGSNLPHWLREAISIPPLRPPEPAILAIPPFGIQWPTQPPSISYGFHHESRNTRISKYSELQQVGSVYSTNLTVGRRNGRTEFSRPGPGHYYAGKQDDLMVINSDASSEETISDDRTVRP